MSRTTINPVFCAWEMKEILLRQIEKQLEMCEEIIELAPDAAWSHAPKNSAPYAAELYHLIDGIRLYLEITIEGGPFEWDKRYLREDGTVNWSRDLEECHTKDEMKALLESVRDRVRREFSTPEMDEYLAGRLPPKVTNRHIGGTFLQGIVYVIRHSQQHIGILYGALRRHGVALPEWR